MSSFEDLKAWQKSKAVAREVILVMNKSKNYALKDQMIRSAISVPSNIAEGAERKVSKEFANFISYASGSCAELITQLMIAEEVAEIQKEEAIELITQCREISKMLYGLRMSISKSK